MDYRDLIQRLRDYSFLHSVLIGFAARIFPEVRAAGA
jgi:hypothetical protein